MIDASNENNSKQNISNNSAEDLQKYTKNRTLNKKRGNIASRNFSRAQSHTQTVHQKSLQNMFSGSLIELVD